jgi:hypothetical protein
MYNFYPLHVRRRAFDRKNRHRERSLLAASWHSQRRYGIAETWRSFVNYEFVKE